MVGKGSSKNQEIWKIEVGNLSAKFLKTQFRSNYNFATSLNLLNSIKKIQPHSFLFRFEVSNLKSSNFSVFPSASTVPRQRLTHFVCAQNLKNVSIFGMSIFSVPIFDRIFPTFLNFENLIERIFLRDKPYSMNRIWWNFN